MHQETRSQGSEWTATLDPESQSSLKRLISAEKVLANRVAGVRSVLVVLSARAVVFDVESLRQKILLAYPEAAIFFVTTLFKPIGAPAPRRVDLVIDFTGPGQRQAFFLAKRLRGISRIAIGRNAGLLRKKLYDRVFDERDGRSGVKLPRELLERETEVQKQVLALAGVALIPMGEIELDRGKSIALELPPLQRN